MPKFEVRAAVYVTVTVDAADENEARDKIHDVDLCAEKITDTEALEVTEVK